MIAIFNELSIVTQQDKISARSMMESFVRAYIHSVQNGITEVRLHESIANIYSWTICQNYLVGQWAQDDLVDRPLRQRFKSIVFKSRIFSDEDVKELSTYRNSEFSFRNGQEIKTCFGLGASYTFDSIAFSLSSMDTWRQVTISINHYFLDEQLQEFSQQRMVNNFYHIESFSSHVGWIQEKAQEAANSSEELWKNKEQLFPLLIFCGETEKQLLKSTLTGKRLAQVRDKLIILNRIAQDWAQMSGTFDARWASENYPIWITGESDCTLSNYGTDRRFRLPDGSFEIFQLHVKFLNEIRIHFFAKAATREIYVGYVGKHLPICSE